MKKKQLNVLITSMGSTTSIVTAKHIRASKLDIKIFGTDMREKNELAGSSFNDVFFKVPSCKDSSYIEIMKNLVKENHIDMIIPIYELEMLALAKNKKEFKDLGCKIISSTPEVVNATNDKFEFYQILKKNQILSPTTFLLKEWKELKDKSSTKWILKPTRGVSSRDIIIGNEKDIIYELSKQNINEEEYIIQEFISGPEYTVDVFVKEKTVYCCVPRERIETRGGLCYQAKTISNKNILPIVEKIISLFDFYGPINIQFIEKDSKLYCIEINARFAGSSIISVASGVNMFEMIYKDFIGEKLKKQTNYKENLVMNRYWEEIFTEQ